jgi:transcriptional regulator with XRE-family HTH domain
MEHGLPRNAIGPSVRSHRSRLNITQADLAARCNLLGFDIGRETVSQIERGKRGVSDLEMILISKALRVEIAELIPKQLPKWIKDLRPPSATKEN